QQALQKHHDQPLPVHRPAQDRPQPCQVGAVDGFQIGLRLPDAGLQVAQRIHDRFSGHVRPVGQLLVALDLELRPLPAVMRGHERLPLRLTRQRGVVLVERRRYRRAVVRRDDRQYTRPRRLSLLAQQPDVKRFRRLGDYAHKLTHVLYSHPTLSVSIATPSSSKLPPDTRMLTARVWLNVVSLTIAKLPTSHVA